MKPGITVFSGSGTGVGAGLDVGARTGSGVGTSFGVACGFTAGFGKTLPPIDARHATQVGSGLHGSYGSVPIIISSMSP